MFVSDEKFHTVKEDNWVFGNSHLTDYTNRHTN